MAREIAKELLIGLAYMIVGALVATGILSLCS